MSEQIKTPEPRKKPSTDGFYVRAAGSGRVFIHNGARAKCLADLYRSDSPPPSGEVTQRKPQDSKISRIFKLRR